MELNSLLQSITRAVEARTSLLAAEPHGALRLFAGFFEGCRDLVIDDYASTLVVFNYARQPEELAGLLPAVVQRLRELLPTANCILLKTRGAADPLQRKGVVLWGGPPTREILENGVRYAVDLQLNQDASFYLDTRGLRVWLKEHCAGKTVLNTFAYTGSLGAAALAGGASRVVQTDLNRTFLNLGAKTCALNGWKSPLVEFRAGDFYRVAGQFKQTGPLFDTVILDAPFFSVTTAGRVDLVNQFERLINKVRPLVKHDGRLVAINNALFVSGVEHAAALQRLCSGGYLQLEELIPVPEDITGYERTRVLPPPVDPSPFNHATKIAVLRVWRKEAQNRGTVTGET